METASEAGAWVRKERERLGLTATELADRTRAIAFKAGFDTKLSQQSISALETGTAKRVPPWFRFVQEALTGNKAEEPDPTIEGDADHESDEAIAQRFDLVPIKSIDMAYGMGATFANERIEVRTRWFPREWVSSLTSTQAVNLTWAPGKGDSMAPTINDGEIVLIDTSERSVFDQDAIWAFTIGETAMMKRLRIRGDKVTIMSDNEHVRDDHAHPDEINIVGRVSHVVKRV